MPQIFLEISKNYVTNVTKLLNYTNRNACVKIFLRKFGCYTPV